MSHFAIFTGCVCFRFHTLGCVPNQFFPGKGKVTLTCSSVREVREVKKSKWKPTARADMGKVSVLILLPTSRQTLRTKVFS